MTTKELEKIYKLACDGKGYEPNDGQFKIWKQTLGWSEECDLSQALTWWFADNTDFPMPALLKPLLEKARLARVARATGQKDLVRWHCPDCGIYRSGFISPNDQFSRRCEGVPKDKRTDTNREGRRICGALMIEVYREISQLAQIH